MARRTVAVLPIKKPLFARARKTTCCTFLSCARHLLSVRRRSSQCAQESPLKSLALDRARTRPARFALTVVLMVCSCAFELESSSVSQPNAVPQLRRGYQASRLVVRGERQRSFSYVAAGRVLKLKEERRESIPDSSHIRRAFCLCDVRSKFADNVALSIVTPDRLIELSGTPPPAQHV